MLTNYHKLRHPKEHAFQHYFLIVLYRSESLWTQMRVSWAELLSGGFWKSLLANSFSLLTKFTLESVGLKSPFPWELLSRGGSQSPRGHSRVLATWPLHLNPSSNSMLNPSCTSTLPFSLSSNSEPLLNGPCDEIKSTEIVSLLATQHKIKRVTPESKGHEGYLKCQAIFSVWGIRFWKVFRKQININLGKERRVNALEYKVDFMEW